MGRCWHDEFATQEYKLFGGRKMPLVESMISCTADLLAYGIEVGDWVVEDWRC